MVKLGISGARGRMGQRIIALAREDKDLKVVFGLEKSGHPDIGKTIDQVKITDQYSAINDCDCLIDFSLASAVSDSLNKALEFKKAVVIGTTGLDQKLKKEIIEASKTVPIISAPNMSVGVNLLFKLLAEAAKILKGYKARLSEAHHIHKKDSPSGTAKRIAEILNQEGFGLKLEDIEAIRKDEIVGDHKIIFESRVDRIELSHQAKTRDIFAQGALRAAHWVVGKPARLYDMQDVLFGEKD